MKKLKFFIVKYNQNKSEKYLNKKAFTLVELIVVITILAILWTIAFLSFQWYSRDARNSVRVSDFANIKKAMNLYNLSNWAYPLPTNTIESTTYSWWLEWELDESVTQRLKLGVIKDPKTNENYKYFLSKDYLMYSIEIEKETWEKLILWWIPKSCKDIQQYFWMKNDWLYTVFLNWNTAIQVYCDMNTDWGGWIKFSAEFKNDAERLEWGTFMWITYTTCFECDHIFPYYLRNNSNNNILSFCKWKNNNLTEWKWVLKTSYFWRNWLFYFVHPDWNKSIRSEKEYDYMIYK